MELYIFDKDDKRLAIISESTGLTSAVIDDMLNNIAEEPFVFTIKENSPKAKFVAPENRVVVKDVEGDLREYIIKELDSVNDFDGPETVAICTPSYEDELNNNIVVERRINNRPAQFALDVSLEGTRFKGVAPLIQGTNSTSFYYETSAQGVWKVRQVWGGDIKSVVLLDETNSYIKEREIHLLPRIGDTRGAALEVGHNVETLERTILSYPKTALYGRGASLELEDEDGEATGGYSRYITFDDVEWSVENGDPVDKPKGQKWVGDPQALLEHGLIHNGELIHQYGEFNNQDYDDPVLLLRATWEALQVTKNPTINYKIIVNNWNKTILLGDTVPVIDRELSIQVKLQARIIRIKYDLLDIEGTTEVEAGDFLNLDDDRIDGIIDRIEKISTVPPKITEGSFPDILPSKPANVTAEGMLDVIQLFWDFEGEYYLKYYEVYGSKIEGFAPSDEHLLYRGNVNSFVHSVGTDQVWYYKLRVVNQHGRVSEWSSQVMGATYRVVTDDMLFGSVTNDILADLSVDAGKLADLSVTGDKLVDNAVTFDKIMDEAITDAKIAAGAVTEFKLEAGAVTGTKLADLAVTASKLVDGAVTSSKIFDSAITEDKLADLSISAGKVQNGIIDDKKLADLSVTADKLVNGSVTNGKIADNAVKSSNILDSAINAAKIASNAVTNTKLSNNAVTSGKLSDLAVTAGKLASGAVTGPKIANNAVGNSKLDDLAVTAGKLADKSVTAVKIANLAVGTAAIDTAAITNVKIENSAITSAKIQDAAITAAKIKELAVGTAAIQDLAVTNAKIDGLHANKINAGRIDTDRIQIGSGVQFADGYDPTKMEIGGRNLLLDSNKVDKWVGYGGSVLTKSKVNMVEEWGFSEAYRIISSGGGTLKALYSTSTSGVTVEPLVLDDVYTYSIYVKNEGAENIRFVINGLSPTGGTSSRTVMANASERIIVTGKRRALYDWFQPRLETTSGEHNLNVIIGHEQLEKGNKGTIWAPAPEDNPALLWMYEDTTFIDGGAIYAHTITANEIAAGAITASSGIIANLAVTSAKIANLAITSGKIQDLAVTSAKIANLAVGNAAIANGAITSAKIQDLAVGTAAIQNAAITNAKIANVAIDTAKIKDAAITTAKINNLAVGTAAIANLAVTNAKIKDLHAEKITAGRIDAARIQIGAGTEFSGAYDTLGNNYNSSKTITAANTGKWFRIASNTGDRAHGRFIIRDTTSGQHSTIVIEAGVHYGRNPYINLTSFGVYTSQAITQARIVYKGTHDHPYLEVYVPTRTSNQSLSYWLTDNIQSSGWVGSNWTNGSIPTGYTTFNRLISTDYVVQSTVDLWRYSDTTFIDGGSLYANSVTANQIAAGTITAASGILANASVTNAKIANLAVTSGKIQNLAVGTAAIANLAVTNGKIANLAVNTAQIASAAITEAKIANLAVTGAKIASATITNAKIANATITSAKISSVDAAKITTGTLKAIDIEGVTIKGSTFYAGSSNYGSLEIGGPNDAIYNLFSPSSGSDKIEMFLGRGRLSLARGVGSQTERMEISDNRLSISKDSSVSNSDMSIFLLSNGHGHISGHHGSTQSLTYSLRLGNEGGATQLSSNSTSLELVSGTLDTSKTVYRRNAIDVSLPSFRINVGSRGTGASTNDLFVSSSFTGSKSFYSYSSTFTTNMVRVIESGALQRSTSSRRYKLYEKEIGLDYARRILDLNVVSWYDKNSIENYAHTLATGEDTEAQPITRVPGIIAEDTHDVGLEMFVTYDGLNRPDGVSSNLPLLMVPILKEHDNEFFSVKERLETQEEKVQAIEEEIAELKNEVNILKGVA